MLLMNLGPHLQNYYRRDIKFCNNFLDLLIFFDVLELCQMSLKVAMMRFVKILPSQY